MDIFIFAGETSGDLHGEKLLKAFYQQNCRLKIFGVGGPKMRALSTRGMECVMPMENFQVMGFSAVIAALPRLIRQFYFLRRMILERNPKAVVLIDYPGFNLRLARSLRKKGYKGKICHYICPSVWAWGKKRVDILAQNYDLLLSILPFEKEYFSKTGLRVEYVGNPLVKEIEEKKSEENILALFPGSRSKELGLNFPLQLKVAKRLREENRGLKIVVSVSQPKFLPVLKEMAKGSDVVFEESPGLMKRASFALAKSGTVTLELALHGVPTIVTYGISPFDLFVAKYLLRIRLPYYCLVNIIAQKEVFPELIGPALTEENLYNSAQKIIRDLGGNRKACQQVRELLGNQEASLRASELILSLL
jgi:lipid-A-disaccharide synthase